MPWLGYVLFGVLLLLLVLDMAITVGRDKVLSSNDRQIVKDNQFLYEYCQHLETRLGNLEFALYQEDE